MLPVVAETEIFLNALIPIPYIGHQIKFVRAVKSKFPEVSNRHLKYYYEKRHLLILFGHCEKIHYSVLFMFLLSIGQ